MDETTLINECLKGNPVAQRKLFDMFAPKMMGVCLRYMKSKQKAEDALQDGFIKVFKNLHKFKKEGSFEGWVRKTIVNTCLDQLRKDKRRGYNTQIEEVDYRLERNDHIVEGLIAEDLLQLVQEMPEGYRVVFNLYAIEGYTHKEVGEKLGISENTSKSQYSRARKHLKTKLEELKLYEGR